MQENIRDTLKHKKVEKLLCHFKHKRYFGDTEKGLSTKRLCLDTEFFYFFLREVAMGDAVAGLTQGSKRYFEAIRFFRTA